MREYVSEAVVLATEPSGDLDMRALVLTERFGKLTAKAKSARKITSKLAGHLQPGNRVALRVIEKNGLHVADALKNGRVNIALPHLVALAGLLADGDADGDLWTLITSGDFRLSAALALLGWDPAAAACAACGSPSVTAMQVSTQDFLCGACVVRIRVDDVLLL